jgi:phosphoglycerate dehydrogenase-like enzyme
MKILLIQTPHTDAGHQITPKHIDTIKQHVPEAEVKLSDEHSTEFAQLLQQADIAVTFNLIVLTKETAPALKWVQITSAGVNSLPDYIKNSAVLLTNSSGVHPIPIAEHILGFMIMLSRQMHVALRNQFVQKTWDRSVGEMPINELSGSTVCVVGLGRIGQHTAMLAKAFGMQVIGVVRNPNRTEDHVDTLVGLDQLNESLKKADFVVNCLPGTSETNHLFNADRFSVMKKEAYFINIGRGTTVNEADLVTALTTKTIAGAGLDVFEHEPLANDSPLWNLENVIITPHYSGRTPYYMDRVIEIFCENLDAFLAQKEMPTLVNKELGY